MIFRRLLLFFSAAALLASCTEGDLGGVTKLPEANVETLDPNAVTLDEALSEMYSLMDDLYGPATRASGRKVANISTFDTPQGLTRSGETARQLAYIVNFEEGGFAVLGASEGVESVLCITEAGSFTEEEVARISTEIAGRTLETRAETEDLDDDFVKTAVLASTLSGPRLPERIIKDPDFKPTNGVFYSSWSNAYNGKIAPFVKVKWNQEPPFNADCPIWPDDGVRTYVGCVAIALAHIIATVKKPEASFYGVSNTWDAIKSVHTYHVGDTSQNLDDLTKILHRIGEGASMEYIKGVSRTSSENAKNYLAGRGYKNVELINCGNRFEERHVTEMLARRLPVYIGAAIGDAQVGHAWTIDGSIRQERTIKRS